MRRLPPWHANAGKRLVKAPKIYVRDSGLVHALLGLRDQETILGHPIVGASWEGFVVETLIDAAPDGTDHFFYRTSAGAEIDLVLSLPNGLTWAVEVKQSLTPKIEKGFHLACEDLKPGRTFLVYPGKERFSLTHDVTAVDLADLARELSAI